MSRSGSGRFCRVMMLLAHGVCASAVPPGWSTAVYCVFLGCAGAGAVGGDVRDAAGGGAGVAAGRGGGRPWASSGSVARQAVLRTIRDGGVAAEPSNGGEHAAVVYRGDRAVSIAGV